MHPTFLNTISPPTFDRFCPSLPRRCRIGGRKLKWDHYTQLIPALYSGPLLYFQDTKLHSLCLTSMLFTLKIWHACISKLSLSLPCPPLSNILYISIIPNSLSYPQVLPWAEVGLFQQRQIVHPVTCRFRTFADLQTKFHIPAHVFFLSTN